MENTEILISHEIKAYLNEIAERLWSTPSHAAVMIGAGFSKNAKSNKLNANSFSDWNELGNAFFQKIHGNLPDEKQHYINVLKLADEVEAAFGRTTLDQLLRKHIPDLEYDPSTLHKKLLELPWTDIFTTNYDTLLERTRLNVPSQKFDIVINQNDLVYSEKPRIIKLHGSFPSERPFIITEEDYRTYPQKFAPFINTVQQSLLENTLCLIGFSGDDPNFLQWIGWIRDNLGKNSSPKIYLIGIFNISDAQKKLLDQRNIVLVDMGLCDGINNDHYRGIELFFNYLASRKQKENSLEWRVQSPPQIKKNENLSVQINNIAKSWKEERLSYPNWIIAPDEIRDAIYTNTSKWNYVRSFPSGLDPITKFNFLYELNWRLELGLLPIDNSIIIEYENTLKEFDKIFIDEKIFSINSIELKTKDYKSKWLELSLSKLRFYREEGFLDQWEETCVDLKNKNGYLSSELLARFYYEQCLQALFTLEPNKLKQLIKEWPSNDSLPFWEAKKAGLLAELGLLNESELLLEKSLALIRTQLNLSPVNNDFAWVSQESYIMLLLQYVNDAKVWNNGFKGYDKEVRENFKKRWRDLKQYKCDPWYELKLYEASILIKDENVNGESVKEEFDIGRTTVSHHFGSSKGVLMGYSYLRFFEVAGLPFRIPGSTLLKKITEKAIKGISNYSPFWALSALIRMGEIKAIDSLFTRNYIHKLDISTIDNYILKYLNAINSVKAEIEVVKTKNSNSWGRHLAQIVPEILSRLCVKCTEEANNKIYDFIYYVYNSEFFMDFSGMGSLVERLINSWDSEKKVNMIPRLLELPILDINKEYYHYEFPEPFSILNKDDIKTNFGLVKIDQEIIKDLLLKVSSDKVEFREKAIVRLLTLNDLNLLNKENVKDFATSVWSQLDPNSKLPTNTNLLNNSFLHIPHPDNVDPKSLLKVFLYEAEFPVQKKKDTEGVSLSGGWCPICIELIKSTKRYQYEEGIDWSSEEALHIFNKLKEWWNLDKVYLKKDDAFGSI